MAAWRGNIIRAASLIHYKQDYFKNSVAFKKQVAKHIQRSNYFLKKLYEGGASSIKKAVKNMKDTFEKFKPFEEYEPYMEQEKERSKEETEAVIEKREKEEIVIKPISEKKIHSNFSLKRKLVRILEEPITFLKLIYEKIG